MLSSRVTSFTQQIYMNTSTSSAPPLHRSVTLPALLIIAASLSHSTVISHHSPTSYRHSMIVLRSVRNQPRSSKQPTTHQKHAPASDARTCFSHGVFSLSTIFPKALGTAQTFPNAPDHRPREKAKLATRSTLALALHRNSITRVYCVLTHTMQLFRAHTYT